MATALDIDTTAISSQAPLEPLVLARLAAGSVTRAELQRDLSPLIEPHLPATAEKALVDSALTQLERRGLAAHEGRGRWRSTEAAGSEIAKLLASTSGNIGDWPVVRNVRLVARALELGPLSQQRVRALARPDGLRAAILQHAFGLPRKALVSPAKLRNQLAVVALQRAFGNTIKDGLGAGEGLSPKAGRLLAGQLARQPRDFGTDSRLVTTLAAECVGATRTDIDGLRLAILRRWTGTLLPASPPAKPISTAAPAMELRRTTPQTVPVPGPVRPAAANRPDLKGFTAAVQAAAKRKAHGWPGNYKAYVSDVWQALAEAHPNWGLSEIEFKGMLAEAHRTGHVRLANADLKDRANLAAIQKSAVVYKNTVWHLVRVED